MPTTHPIHNADPAYAPPVIRTASPTNSLSTEYGPDETSLSDTELNNADFAKKCDERIRSHGLWVQVDETANHGVLLPKPKNNIEEKQLHEAVMRNLHKEVAALEQEELFEAAMLNRSQALPEQQPSSHDIDVIMQSMLGPPPSGTGRGRRSSGYAANGDNSGRMGLNGKGKGKSRR